MNDELRKLEHQLEQATPFPGEGAESSPDVLLDCQTASLREGWLIFGQLLEAAQPTPDEPLKLAAFSSHGTMGPAATRRSPHAQGSRAVVSVVAASLLIGVTLMWSVLETTSSNLMVKPSKPVPPTAEDTESNVVQPQHAIELTEVDLQWDDPLDQQIARAGQELTRVEQDWYYVDDAFASVSYALEQTGEEIDDNTL